MNGRARKSALALAFALSGFSSVAFADGMVMPDQGKLLATGGVIDAEGTGGGGLVPWALITGYGTADSYGANVHYTYLQTQDYRLTSPGVAFGFADRFEVSFANQMFEGTDKALNGVKIRQDIIGLKVKVIGDAVYDQDSFLPQVAVGAEFKNNRGITGLEGLGVHNPTDLGAKNNSGTDFYIAATKVFLDESLLLDATVRFTKANQFGLLGFGGDKSDATHAEFEGSIAYLLTRKLAIGAEYREKPHNLSIDDESDAYDAFIAWFPTRNVSITAAYVRLGSIVKPFNPTDQKGPYVSLQVGF